MKKRHLAVAMLLPLLFLTGFDCWGPPQECEPPEELSYGSESVYCQRGERGYCSAHDHSNTSWNPLPCPDGSVCTMVEGRGQCLRPDGSEAPEPETVCAAEGLSECDASGFRRCELAPSGDLLWTSRAFCNGFCHEGHCQARCAFEDLGSTVCALAGYLDTCQQVDNSRLWVRQDCGEGQRCYSGEELRGLSCGVDAACLELCQELECSYACHAEPDCAQNWDVDKDACAPDPWTKP